MALKSFEELNLELMREALQFKPVSSPEGEDVKVISENLLLSDPTDILSSGKLEEEGISINAVPIDEERSKAEKGRRIEQDGAFRDALKESDPIAVPEVASGEEWVRDMLGFSWDEGIPEADEFLDEPERMTESEFSGIEATVGAVETAEAIEVVQIAKKAEVAEAEETADAEVVAVEDAEIAVIVQAMQEVEAEEESDAVKLSGKKTARKRPAQKSNWKSRLPAIVSDVLFYMAILLVLVPTVLAKPSDGSPITIKGYSYFSVLTTSMQSEMPKGSFILVHETNPQELEVGENITFMRSESISVTHQIENIYENYDGNGARAFQTKGVDNVNPDSELVHEKDVVGKVILVIPKLGAFISYINSHIVLVFVLLGMSVLFVFSLRRFYEYLGKKRMAIRSEYDTNEAVAS